MGSLSILSVIALAVAVYYTEAMQGSGRRTIRSDSSNVTLRVLSRGSGDAASGDLQENINRVTSVIDMQMAPDQQSSNDPCRTLQIFKERNNQAAPLPRSSRPSAQEQLTPSSRKAENDCATAVNAFKALPPGYRTECPVVYSSMCRYIDSFYTCSVAIPGKMLGCFPGGTQFVSLKRCAVFAFRQIESERRERRNNIMYRREEEALAQRAREAQGYTGGDVHRPAQPDRGGNVQLGSGRGCIVQRPIQGGGGAGAGPRPGAVVIRENTNVNRRSRSFDSSSSLSHIARNSQDHSGPSNWQDFHYSSTGSF